MHRTVTLIALSASLAGLTQPSKAFWPRSQLMACSEVIREADYQRWRCWELDAFAGGTIPSGRDRLNPNLRYGPGEPPSPPPLGARVVRRLG